MEIIISNWWVIILVIVSLILVKNFSKKSKVDIKKLVEDGAVIVDVRTEAEYKSGHIEKSINVPLGDLTYRISEFNKEDNIITVCAAGIRAESAKKYFISKGYNATNGGKWSNIKDII